MDLGLVEDEFWSLQPRQFAALRRRHERSLEDNEFLFAQLTACVVNFSMARPKQSARAKDFMPSQIRQKAAAPKKKSRRAEERERQKIADELRARMAPFVKR